MTNDAPRSGVLPCIFVSAVSRELASARSLVANCLRVFYGVEVIYQQAFGLKPGELLAQLRSDIDRSAGVLQLVGEIYGAALPDDDPEFGPVSYTQYEFLYALKQKKTTWLIEVGGDCTRDINVPEFLFDGELDARSTRLDRAYRARLLGLNPGGQLVANAQDDADMKKVIAEHNRRRRLQREYYRSQSQHVRGKALDDDELVRRVQELKGVPRVKARSGKFKIVNPYPALKRRFVGRASTTYDALARFFGVPDPGPHRIVLHGLGGSGKSTIASEIGYAYHTTGHHVLMIQPVPGGGVDLELAKLARLLNLTRKARVTRDTDANLTRAWLQEKSEWLMIVDGVDDVETAESVEALCAEFSECHFLITSRLDETSWIGRPEVETQEVDVLDSAAAHRLLLDLAGPGRRRRDQEEDTLSLTAVLGGLPLAIRHARGYLDFNRSKSIESYIAELEKARLLPQTSLDQFAPKLRPIAATWQISLERMHPVSRTLLRLMSFLTDQPIPVDLIESQEVAGVLARACAADPFEHQSKEAAGLADAEKAAQFLTDALNELGGYSFIQTLGDTKQIKMHRLVLQMTQGSLRAVSAEVLPHALALQHALASLEHSGAMGPHRTFMAHAIRFLTDYLAREGPTGRTRIYPHLFHLASLYREQEDDGSTKRVPLSLAADELNFLGETFSLSGKSEDAVRHFSRAASTPEAVPYERARANQGLAWSFFGENQIRDALGHYQIAEQALDGQPSDKRHDGVRYEVYSGRGWTYRFVGNLEPAIEDLQRALALARKAKDQGQLADAFVNLGGAYDYAGDYPEAEARYRDAVDIADSSNDPYLRGLTRYLFAWFLIRRQSREEGMALCREAKTLGDRFGFGIVKEEARWIMSVGHAMDGDLSSAVEMADQAAEMGSEFLVDWEHMIRGIMRFRVRDEPGAKEDFELAVEGCEKSVAKFEHFDPLDTLAFSHAGLALLGQPSHLKRAVTAYRRARALAPAPGIVDIGRQVFGCLGSDVKVTAIAHQLFG